MGLRENAQLALGKDELHLRSVGGYVDLQAPGDTHGVVRTDAIATLHLPTVHPHHHGVTVEALEQIDAK